MYTAIDLFAGAGGLSRGLKDAGFSVRAGVEVDPTSAASYRRNHPETFLVQADIKTVTGPRLLQHAGLRRGELNLLTGCPPCQGFSTLRTRRKGVSSPDPRNDLIFDLLRLVRSMKPRAVLIENVPGLTADERFVAFRSGLLRAGYHTDFRIVDAQHFGVPQRRRRLVLVGLYQQRVPESVFQHEIVCTTVRQALADLPTPGRSGDNLHDLPARRTDSVLRRIRAIPHNGGSQRDLPREHLLACHQRSDGYSDVYGRMAWDEVAPTITSGCHNPSKGRFLHPDEDRAITLREAALLQTFPRGYEFDLSRGKEHVAWQIGNAFPPRLIHSIASALMEIIPQ